MTDLKFTEEDASEAFFNIGKLAGRIPSDEGKRLFMLIQVVASRMTTLQEYVVRLEEALNKHESPPTKKQLQAEITRLKGEE
jgi:hypothetical protein